LGTLGQIFSLEMSKIHKIAINIACNVFWLLVDHTESNHIMNHWNQYLVIKLYYVYPRILLNKFLQRHCAASSYVLDNVIVIVIRNMHAWLVLLVRQTRHKQKYTSNIWLDIFHKSYLFGILSPIPPFFHLLLLLYIFVIKIARKN
jgi:hypothetical protein